MRNLAETKRTLTVGRTVTMVRHDWFPNGKLIDVPRRVKHVQGNAVQFEGGSWLHWPKAAEFRATDEGFELQLGDAKEDNWMGYVVGE